eukprot:scaffold2083_cov169-Pinguiococcus_pyrenoidosus.AAC.2
MTASAPASKKARPMPSTPSANSSPRALSQADSTTSGERSLSLAVWCALRIASSWQVPEKARPPRSPTCGSATQRRHQPHLSTLLLVTVHRRGSRGKAMPIETGASDLPT